VLKFSRILPVSGVVWWLNYKSPFFLKKLLEYETIQTSFFYECGQKLTMGTERLRRFGKVPFPHAKVDPFYL